MNRIKELREEIGMTQVRLSIELEVAQETVSAYEQGKHNPSVNNLIKLSKIFSASIDYILGLTDIRYTNISSDLNKDEQKMINLYNKLSYHQKELVKAYIQGIIDG